MSAQSFLIFLTVGAALLGLWTVVRFPRLGPTSLAGSLIQLALALLVGMAVSPLMSVVVGSGLPLAGFIAIFGLALPALTYMFLTGAWLIRFAQTQALRR
jgi:hypothetical protein